MILIGEKFECYEWKCTLNSGKVCKFVENSQNSLIVGAKCEKLGMIAGI